MYRDNKGRFISKRQHELAVLHQFVTSTQVDIDEQARRNEVWESIHPLVWHEFRASEMYGYDSWQRKTYSHMVKQAYYRLDYPLFA